MAKEFNIVASDGWFVGEDKTLEVYCKQPDGITEQDMTGWALTYELMLERGSSSAEFSKTVGSGIAIGNGLATGDLATVTIADTDTEALGTTGWVKGTKTFYHRLRRTDSGSETMLMYGTVELNENEGT